eukprot:TRINITY_DN4638_c0_g1_i1.p1 TRINITY_DN4638_c0_g1~~TRINITY_DN4638_c0_g1_i1.p1  ORF type:complete len:306 (-),score=47.97 TRINITY_DN4638_c0_g1_i1:81-998(-)
MSQPRVNPITRMVHAARLGNQWRVQARGRADGSTASHHSWLYSTLRPHSHRTRAKIYSYAVTILILLNVGVFVVSTHDALDECKGPLYVFEAVSSCFFAAEYLARLYTLNESKRWKDRHPVWSRCRWAVTAEGVIDLVSFLPFFLELIIGTDLPTLTYLRVLRLVRILKSSATVDAFDCVARVCYFNQQILLVSATVCAALMLVTATVLFYLKPPDDENNQFSSVLATMYLTTLMLTGQGHPSGSLPWYTKLVCGVTAFISVGIFAIPASMLTWGSVSYTHLRAHETVLDLVCRLLLEKKKKQNY